MKNNAIFLSAVFTALLIATSGATYAAPQITAATLPKHPSDKVTVTGTDFGQFGGVIASWDDFERHTVGAKVNGLSPINGHVWTTLYGYPGNGIAIDRQFSVSGSQSVKVDWGIDPEGIRAFGWAGKGPYKTLYISYWRLMTGNFIPATTNHKQFYLYGNKSGFPEGMPFIPGGQDGWGFYNNVSTGPITELNPNPNNMNNKGWKWSNTNNIMQRWEFFIKLNEPYTAKNGVIQAWLNGQKGIDNQAYQMRHVDGEFIDFRLGHMAQGFYTSAKAWFDDIYIATTQARIEVCNSNIYNNCTIKHLQYVEPNRWSDTSISFDLRNIGAFKDIEAYLYVIDKDGQVSSPIPLSKPLAPTT